MFRRYLSTLWLSLSSPKAYVQFLNYPIWSSLLFFGLSYLFLGWIAAAAFTFQALPEYRGKTDQALAELVERFPAELVLTWDGSKLLTTPNQTVPVPFPNAWGEETKNWPYRYLAVIFPQVETLQNLDLNTHLPGSSLIVVSQTSLASVGFNEQLREIPLTEVASSLELPAPLLINRETIGGLVAQLQPQLAQLWQILPFVLGLVMPVLLVATRLWVTLLNTIIIHLTWQLLGRKMSWLKVWQLSLHVSVAAEVLHQSIAILFRQAGWPIFEITFWLLFMMLSYFLRNVQLINAPKTKRS